MCEAIRGIGNCLHFSMYEGGGCWFSGALDPGRSCDGTASTGWTLWKYTGMEGLPWVLWLCTVCIYPMANWVVICLLAMRSTPTRAVDEQGRISVSDFRFLRVFMDV